MRITSHIDPASSALTRQIRGGDLDYISMDFLAEVTMSIMQKQRSRDPSKGYAHDFIGMLKPIFKDIMDKNITVITNAGGVNPCTEDICAIPCALIVAWL